MSANGRKILELIEKREKLEGTRIFRILSHLAISLYCVNRNYNELSIAIGKYESDLSIWKITNRAKLDAFLREFLRLLQNYLSSVYSLIQHTIILRDKLSHHVLSKNYAIKMKALQSNNCVRFVRDLRTYSQHIKLPFISAILSFKKTGEKNGGGKIEQKILLEKGELMKWKNWNIISVKYINSHKELDLKVTLSDYQNLNKTFYNWFYSIVVKLYSKELHEFAKIDAEIGKLQ